MKIICDDLVISPMRKTKLWKLRQSWEVAINYTTVIIPKGFETDFASVPRLFWILAPPATGKYNRCAVLHDYMYKTGYRTKLYADTIFLQYMRECGVNVLKRRLMYYAVRLFGRGSY